MKKVGRPKGEENKEHICSIRMDDRTWKCLEAYCQKMGIAKSVAVRTAIEEIVSEEDL